MEGDKEVPPKGPAGAGEGQGHTPFEVTFDKWRRSYERDHAEHVSKLGEIMRKDMEDRLSSYRQKVEEEEKAEIKKAKEAKDKRLSNYRLQLEEEENVERRKAKEAKDNRVSSYRQKVEEEETVERRTAKEAKDKRLYKLKEDEAAEMRKVKEVIDARLDAFRKEEEAKAEDKTREIRQKIRDVETSFAAARSRFSLLEQTTKNFQRSLFQNTPDGTTSPNVDGSSGQNPLPPSPERTRMPPKKKIPPAFIEDPASTLTIPLKRFRKHFVGETYSATTGDGDQATTSALDASTSTSVEYEDETLATSPNFDGDGSSVRNPPPQSPPTKDRTGTPPKKKKTPPEDPASTSGSPSKRLRQDSIEPETETKSVTTGDGDQAATSTTPEDEDKTLESLSLDLDEFPNCPLGKALKFFQDLKNQLNSPLSYLKVSGTFSSQREVLLLDKILHWVSTTLQHLALDITTQERLNLRCVCNWAFGNNLKILEMSIHGSYYDGFHQFTNDVFHKIGPSSLEKFIGRGDYGVGPDILPFLAERNAFTLNEISLSGSRHDELHSLAELPTDLPLQKLAINGADNTDTIYKILQKFSNTLVSLDLKCFTKLVIPSLEKLEFFSLEYNNDTWISPGDFSYSKKLPALKTLTLDSCKGRALSDYTKAEALTQWGLNEALFNAFIPSDQVCSSVEELNIPHCPPESKGKNKEYADRLKAMRTLFPNVKGKWIMWK